MNRTQCNRRYFFYPRFFAGVATLLMASAAMAEAVYWTEKQSAIEKSPHATVNNKHPEPQARDPFAATALMQENMALLGDNTAVASAMTTLHLRGIVKGRWHTALIETGSGIWPLQKNERFHVQTGQQRLVLQVRRILDDSVEIGNDQQTLMTLR